METGRKIDLSLAGGLALLALLGVAAIITAGRFARHAQWVAHTQEVRANIRLFDAQLREARSDVRSFVITGDSTFIGRYRRSIDTAETQYATLQQATGDNRAQQQRLAALRPLLNDRRSSFDRTLLLRPAGAPGPTTLSRADSRLVTQLEVGETLSARIGAIIGDLDRAEAVVLAERAGAQRRSEVALGIVVLAIAAFGVAFGVLLRRSIRGDLTDRAHMEQALRESEAKFSGIINIAADAIITVDAQQMIQLFNDGAERIFGYERREVLGKPLDLLLPVRLAESHRRDISDFARASESARRMGERRQVLGRRASGEEFPADASISKLSTAQGSSLFTVVLRDVTEQKRLERHEHILAESSRNFIDTTDYAALLKVVTDTPTPALGDWCLLDVIEDSEDAAPRFRRVASDHALREKDVALRALAARGLDEDSPSRVLDVIRAETPELIAEVSDEWLEAHTDAEELRLMRVLGVRSMLIVPLVSRGRVIGAMTIGAGSERRLDQSDLALVQAIADRASLAIQNARLYEAAQRASAMRDRVLGVVSHDLRNPLSAVSMYAHTLLEHPPVDDGERRVLYRLTLDAVEWMHRMMEDLVDVASIDAGRLAVLLEPQLVAQIVEATLNMMSARAAADEVTLVTDVDPLTPLVSADAARVVQVLTNLVSNAIKFTPAGGRVTIGAAPRGTEVLFSVRDTGAGIAAEHLEHVFDRFWQHRGEGRRRGTGLGLAIARGIVAAHGGRIWAESSAGGGSTFHFTLLAVPAASEKSAVPSLGTAQHSARPIA
jgi:PAS domain S-box-containing protein